MLWTHEHAALLTFHGDLRELLAGKYRTVQGAQAAGDAVSVAYPVARSASIKDVVEALGAPHTEIYRITADGVETDFGLRLAPGARVDLYPAIPPIDPRVPTRLRPEPLQRLVFVVDANVGRVATFLRLLGLDAAYNFAWSDAQVAAIAEEQGRVAITRDRALLKRKKIVYGRLIRSSHPDEQLREVVAFFGLQGPFALFSRCMRCNARLEPVAKAEIEERLLPLTKKYYHEFHRCPVCARVYWPGAHHENMRERIGRLLQP